MQTLSAHMLKILNHLHVAKSCDDVHQGADATLLCELCLEKGLQADSISSAVSHSGAPMSQQQQHAVAGQKGLSLSPKSGWLSDPAARWQTALQRFLPRRLAL